MSLVKTLVTFMFEKYVLQQSTIEIGGAPSWYEKREDSDKLYAFAYANGDLSAVDAAKLKARNDLVKQIKYAMDVVVSKNFSRLEGDEKVMVERLQHDTKLKGFVFANMVIPAMKYDEKQKRAYVGAYLTKTQIEAYSKSRVYEIKIELLNLRHNKLTDELEREAS